MSEANNGKYDIKDEKDFAQVKYHESAEPKVDYSGAHAKTDPREIALVKKLDWYIMPILWLMYWLNYLVL
jgi:hypothetical protein